MVFIVSFNEDKTQRLQVDCDRKYVKYQVVLKKYNVTIITYVFRSSLILKLAVIGMAEL